jgi:hypothetical protein
MRPGAVIEEGFADPVPNDLLIRVRIPPCDLLDEDVQNQFGELTRGRTVAIAQPSVEGQ